MAYFWVRRAGNCCWWAMSSCLKMRWSQAVYTFCGLHWGQTSRSVAIQYPTWRSMTFLRRLYKPKLVSMSPHSGQASKTPQIRRGSQKSSGAPK